jgi:hypothetical protein
MEKKYTTFASFYPYYLSEHRNTTCRTLHFIGSTIVLGIVATMFITQQWWMGWLIPLAGYGFAWVGHFFFEHNRPATFTYPFYSFAGDWVMYSQLLTGKIGLTPRADELAG